MEIDFISISIGWCVHLSALHLHHSLTAVILYGSLIFVLCLLKRVIICVHYILDESVTRFLQKNQGLYLLFRILPFYVLKVTAKISFF